MIARAPLDPKEAGLGIMKALLNANVNVNAKNDKQQAPLHLAVESGVMGCVELLLNAGAAVNVKDAQDQTALHRAATRGSVELVKILLDRGAVDDIDENGYTAFHLARVHSKRDLIEHLCQHRLESNDDVVRKKRAQAVDKEGFELNTDCLICLEEFERKSHTQDCLSCFQRYHVKCMKRCFRECTTEAIHASRCVLCRRPTFEHLIMDTQMDTQMDTIATIYVLDFEIKA